MLRRGSWVVVIAPLAALAVFVVILAGIVAVVLTRELGWCVFGCNPQVVAPPLPPESYGSEPLVADDPSDDSLVLSGNKFSYSGEDIVSFYQKYAQQVSGQDIHPSSDEAGSLCWVWQPKADRWEGLALAKGTGERYVSFAFVDLSNPGLGPAEWLSLEGSNRCSYAAGYIDDPTWRDWLGGVP